MMEVVTGYSAEEFKGINLNDIYVYPNDRKELIENVKTSRGVVDYLVRLKRKDGTNYNASLTIGIVNIAGINVLQTLLQDITERSRAEEKINNLLAEKELLLKEVHHRIKNNMSTMISMLSLQAETMEDASASSAIKSAEIRMHSMAVLYDKLYRSYNLREMSIKDYLPYLVDEIVGNFPNCDMVKIEKYIDDFVLGVNVLHPLGIIVNELITNAMKHAFVGRDDGVLCVSASIKGSRVTIVVEDNGVGLPESIHIESSTKFGIQLVSLLTKQIGGSIKIERLKGTQFVLEFEASR
jgi:PAS domain S-box-containing protein